MGKNKLKKFAEVDNFGNCFFLSFEQSKERGLQLKGKWNTEFFKNQNPIVVELGCGKGEYTIGLAQRYPHKNFIGIDIKGNRIHAGAKMAIEMGLNNVAFIRTRIDFIESCFETNEVSEIWITFPDPQPQKTRERKRLTNSMFLNRYRMITNTAAIINLKTDNEPFYDFSKTIAQEQGLKILDATNDLYADEKTRAAELTGIQTYYEKLFSAKGFKICFLSYQL
jgi:tRNA (guanine-N7-)-methyltransferase